MKPILALVGLIISLAVLLAGIALWWLLTAFNAPGPVSEERFLVVERGESLGHIAAKLESEGLLKKPLVFKLIARLSGAAADLKAGEYAVPASASAKDILELLRSGKVYHRSVTIPEGRTSWEIVQIVNALDVGGAIKSLPDEGALLPETYSYTRADTCSSLIARMEVAMDEVIEDLWPGRAENLPFERVEEAITLASIVEKETGVAGERAKVAGVFINRLRKGMPLQSDPTVIYALTRGQHENTGKGPLGRRLLRKDLAFDSPYNTYKHTGLPPGPIANPGRGSIEAVLHPEEHDYLYFVADGTGGHAFAKTLDEHNRNVAVWRKIRRESGR